MSKETKDLAITDDLKPVLEMLKPEDAGAIVELREELGENWRKKQIFRTETETVSYTHLTLPTINWV